MCHSLDTNYHWLIPSANELTLYHRKNMMASGAKILPIESKKKLVAMYAAKEFQQALKYGSELMQSYPEEVFLHDISSAIWLGLNRPDKALLHAEEALKINPDYTNGHFNLGVILSRLDKQRDSFNSYQKTLSLDPNHIGALLNSAELLIKNNHLQNAIRFYDKVISLAPKTVVAHANRGVALKKLGQLEEALRSYTNTLELEPDDINTMVNKGLVLFELNRLDDAIACYDEALSKIPSHVNARLNRASALNVQGKHSASKQEVEKVLEIDPDNILAKTNYGHALLAMGDFERGWFNFEWRLRKESFASTLPQNTKRWTDQDLSGKSILILAEQGIGDQIQFARYTHNLVERGASVILQCDAKLLPLFKHNLPTVQLVPKDTPLPLADFYCPMLSIPGQLGENLGSPHKTPYLSINASHVEAWAEHLEVTNGFRVGVNWQGNPSFKRDQWRSFALSNFRPLAEIDTVQLISLQKGKQGVSQIPEFRDTHPIIDIDELAQRETDSEDAAAAIMNLDLVITSCTSIAHLSGALGKPTWVVLGTAADWRWLLDREDSPWYPNIRLFRQTEFGNWSEVFNRVKTQLQILVEDA